MSGDRQHGRTTHNAETERLFPDMPRLIEYPKEPSRDDLRFLLVLSMLLWTPPLLYLSGAWVYLWEAVQWLAHMFMAAIEWFAGLLRERMADSGMEFFDGSSEPAPEPNWEDTWPPHPNIINLITVLGLLALGCMVVLGILVGILYYMYLLVYAPVQSVVHVHAWATGRMNHE